MSPIRHELVPGYSISRIINGCWQLSAGHGPIAIDRAAVVDDLLRLIDGGLTTFDCADIYTGVETLLGELVRRYRERGGDPALEGLQIHTKCVPDLDALPQLSRREVTAIVDRSLQRLGVERLDLVQLHWWDYEVPGYVEVAGWLAELQHAGKIRLLGATNFDVSRLRELVDAGVDLVTLQTQYSLLDRRPEGDMRALCREHGIQLLCYGALAGGFLAEAYRGLDQAPAPDNRSQIKYRLILDQAGGWAAFQRLLDALAEVAGRHGASLANVAVRWVLERQQVAATMIGVRNANRLADNLQALELELDTQDEAKLASAVAGLRPLAGDPFDLERIPGGEHRRIMKTGLNRRPC
ncbi:MAG: aldo/keto reductase [Acidobacteriota bacterium]